MEISTASIHNALVRSDHYLPIPKLATVIRDPREGYMGKVPTWQRQHPNIGAYPIARCLIDKKVRKLELVAFLYRGNPSKNVMLW